LEEEIRVLQNQETAASIIAIRDTKPKEARMKVLQERLVASQVLREQLEAKLREKEAEDAIEEERRADKIRQQKALNTVHKQHIKVFDPTDTAGTGVMDEMSYMEMKERLDMVRIRDATIVANKKQEILEMKEKRAHTLNEKADGIMKARQMKNEATRAATLRRKEQEKREAQEKEKARVAAAELLEVELRTKREAKKEEQEALRAEAERVKRQQQYLGAAMGRVDETRAEQILLGQEREARTLQHRIKDEAVKKEEAYAVDRANREDHRKHDLRAKRSAVAEKDQEAIRERRIAIEKMKEDYLQKKAMVRKGRAEYAEGREVVKQHNLYAAKIAEESLARSKRSQSGRK
jgi:hypothetical protein